MNWQPIETAPKDGSLILLGAPNGVWVGKYLPVYTSGFAPKNPWSSMLLNHDHMAERYTRPTHWMPLPAAPGAPAAHESFEDRISDWAHGDALDAERYRWLFGARTAEELEGLTADSGPPPDKPQDYVLCELMANYVTKAYADAMIDSARADQAAATKEAS